MGRSILFASGDSGVGCNSACTQFVPGWPASSPYVTAVGGVVYYDDTFYADSISTGGFSFNFTAQKYQLKAVNQYLTSGVPLPPSSFYNSTGRAIPDIASFSEDLIIIVDGSEEYVSGTSCAAPVVSGIISLLNDARLNAKKSTLGFLNPFLYTLLYNHPDAFFDVTQGNNDDGCCIGFEATAGWDPITGVGAPNFPKLLQYALQKN